MLLSDLLLVSKAQRGGIMAYDKHLRQCCLDGQPSDTVTVVMPPQNFSMREVIVNLDSLDGEPGRLRSKLHSVNLQHSKLHPVHPQHSKLHSVHLQHSKLHSVHSEHKLHPVHLQHSKLHPVHPQHSKLHSIYLQHSPPIYQV